jgi:hypothetical protein
MDEEDNDTGEEEVARAREAAGGGGGPSSSSCEYTDLAHSIDDVVDDGSVVMRYSLHPSTTRNSNDGLLCVRLEVDMDDIDIVVTNGGGDGDGGGGGGRGTWIGLAISPDGKMDGSRAIIGTLTVGSATTANDDDDGGDIREGGVDVVIADGDGADVAGSTVGSVMKYELGTSEWRGFASRMDENRQTLIDASIFIEEYDYRTDEQQRPDDDVGDDKITIVIGGDDNDIDEDDIVMTNAKGRRIVMTFGKLLIEDDGWDVYDLPIYERGNNHFLFARGRYGGNGDGGANELGYHAVRATFVKDFDDDITDVSFSLCFVPLLDALGGGGSGWVGLGGRGAPGGGGWGGDRNFVFETVSFSGTTPRGGTTRCSSLCTHRRHFGIGMGFFIPPRTINGGSTVVCPLFLVWWDVLVEFREADWGGWEKPRRTLF